MKSGLSKSSKLSKSITISKNGDEKLGRISSLRRKSTLETKKHFHKANILNFEHNIRCSCSKFGMDAFVHGMVDANALLHSKGMKQRHTINVQRDKRVRRMTRKMHRAS